MPPAPPLKPPSPSDAPGSPVPLWAPYYNAPVGVAVRRFFSKYYTFSGRASRSEFWWWTLVAVIISFVLNIILTAVGGNQMDPNREMSVTGVVGITSIIVALWGLFTLIPSLALQVRRLHDTDRSGFWILIGLVPIVGWIVLIVFSVGGPNPEGARFDRPKN